MAYFVERRDASTRVSICYDTRNNKERLFRTSATNYNLN